MGLSALLSIFRPRTEVRYVHATKAESKRARRKAIDRQLELAVAVSQLTPDQVDAAKARAVEAGKGER